MKTVVTFILSLCFATSALAADLKAVEEPSLGRGYCIGRLTIRFPWGVCYTSYSSRYGCYPSQIRGYACGTYVRCSRLGSSRRYYCRW